MLSRDYDPQLFEMLLGETSADANVASLTMSDLLLPDQCRPTNDGGLSSVRPFLFNMPQHMTEYTSSRIDDLVLVYEGDPGQVLLRYEYKKDFYNRNQLPISASSGREMEGWNQMNEDHKQLLSSSSDIKSYYHSTSNAQDDKISLLEKTLQGKEEAYRNEIDTFLKETYKKEIISLNEEILLLKKEAASEILSGKLDKALQKKKMSTGMSL